MKIVHYTLGLPPSRTGGLTQYTIDLVRAEAEAGIDVTLIYPGKVSVLNRRTHFGRIKFNSDIGVNTIQMINSLPLAIFGGIKTPAKFMVNQSNSQFLKLLTALKPDCIHLHTLMGLPIEFILAAQKLNIPVMLTMHDYFGIAPEPTFFFDGNNYDDNNTDMQWARIGVTAMPTWKLRMFQLPFYPMVRRIAHSLRRNSETELRISNVSQSSEESITAMNVQKYTKLRQYYRDMYSMVNFMHFNSELSRHVFESQLGRATTNCAVVPLSNSNIKTHIYKKKPSTKIRIAFFGQDTQPKGFPVFFKLAKVLPSNKYSFHTYGYTPTSDYSGIVQHGRYQKSELENIYRNTDLTIVPSLCKETLGFVALESIASGTPTLVSQNVGAKDMLSENAVFNSFDDLILKIEKFKPGDLISGKVDEMSVHVRKICDLYARIISNVN